MSFTRLAHTAIAAFVLLAAGMGCYQGKPSDKPPIHLQRNMFDQPKYKAQGKSDFYEDGATMRTPPAGTVAREHAMDKLVLYTGKTEDGEFARIIPVEVDMTLLERGRQRYDIYCAPCHSRVGDGKGIMIKRGYVPPTNLHDQRVIDMSTGQLFDVISNGVRNMPSYRHQIPVEDRWAIIAYVRALQRSQNAGEKDIPEEIRERVKRQP